MRASRRIQRAAMAYNHDLVCEATAKLTSSDILPNISHYLNDEVYNRAIVKRRLLNDATRQNVAQAIGAEEAGRLVDLLAGAPDRVFDLIVSGGP